MLCKASEWHAGLVRPMERPAGASMSHRPSRDKEHPHEVVKNRWAAAGQAVLNPSLQKEQGFPNSMGRSHFPRSATYSSPSLHM